MTTSTTQSSIPRATVPETLAVIAEVITPTIAKGVIIRRPKAVSMAEGLDLDRRAVRRMQTLQDKYGTGPLMLRTPKRSQALILNPEHVHRVLDHSPEPFATATAEKRAALAHFEPKVSLISHGPEREERRQFNDEVLDSHRPVHRMAEPLLRIVDEEARAILDEARRRGELSWDTFEDAWFRLVRRVIFGDGARDDHELSSITARLRSSANWAFFKPKPKRLQERFHDRVNAHLERAEPGSLAGVMAGMPTTGTTKPSHQVAQWLFAFDPAGMATFRALALLATHPEQAGRARQEIRERPGSDRAELPYLRACVLESLRLWPTTPMVLRESTSETTWETGVMPEQTSILIFAPFFHRDDRHLSFADRFEPDLWLSDRPADGWPLIPFSDGPAICPGRHLVLLLTSAMLSALFDDRPIRLTSLDRLDPGQPLPGTLNHYTLRFGLDG